MIKNDKNKLSLFVICVLVFLGCFVLGLKFIINESYSLADESAELLDIQLLNLDGSSQGEVNMITNTTGFTDELYISNSQYFIANPLHAKNDGSDNPWGTCTTVAMQILLGYHNYFSDRRLIPQINSENKYFLSSNYGDLLEHPELIPTGNYPDLGLASFGTTDEVYKELMDLNAASSIPGIGQSIGNIVTATRKFVSKYAQDIEENVNISNGIYSKDIAIDEINADRPIILGYNPLSSDGSFHIVVAYGYATYNGEFGYIVHYGWGKDYVKIWVPSSWFGFYIKMSIEHTHSIMDAKQNINDIYRKLECKECGYTTFDDIYEYNLTENAITRVKYPLGGIINIPINYNGHYIKKIANGVFKETDVREVNLSYTEFIGDSAFENCANLVSINLPNIIYIGEKSFYGCTSLTTIQNARNLSEIGIRAFSGCYNLNLQLNNNSSFSVYGNVLYNQNKTKLIQACNVGLDIIIPASVTEILPYAFEGNINVNNVYFESTPLIRDYAFADCADLNIHFVNSDIPEIEVRAFSDSKINIFVPYYIQSKYKETYPQYADKITSTQISVMFISDGITVKTIDTYNGAEVELPSISKRGHYFNGWFTDPSFNGTPYNEEYWQSDTNITLYAKWLPKIYTITLNANGGTLSGADKIDVIYGQKYSISTSVEKIGYTFEGWADADRNKLSTENGESKDVWNYEKDLTLYAGWGVKSYEIQINDNGTIIWLGKDGLSDDKCSIEYGTVISAINLIHVFKESNQGFKEGKIFDHFEYDGEKFNWTSVPDLGESGAIVTIIPIWVLERHTIHFSSTYGAEISPLTVEYGGKINLPVLSQTGYTFNGWYTKPVGGNEVTWLRMPDLTPTEQNNGSVSIYAHWTANKYYVYYLSNGGSGTMGYTLFEYNKYQNLRMNSFTKTGHNFKGWATSSNGGVVYSDGQLVSNLSSAQGGRVNLYAVWEAKTYSIIYSNLTSDMYIHPSTFTYGVGLPAIPKLYVKVRNGLEEVKVNGWYTDNGQSISSISPTRDSDITLTAKYEYKVEATYSSATHTVTDGKIENQPSFTIGLMLRSFYNNIINGTGLEKIKISISLYLWEINDGYQDFYLYNGDTVIWSETKEHGAGKKNSTAARYTFNIELDIADYSNADYLDLRFGAHGAFSDDWQFNNFEMTVYFTH